MKLLKFLVFLILLPYLLTLFLIRLIRMRSIARAWYLVTWTWEYYWNHP